MSKRFRVAIIAAVAILACLGGAAILEIQTKVIRRVFDNLIYDNQNHYLPCEKLPIEAEVNRIMEQHQDKVRTIEQVNPGLVGVDLDTMTCPGRGDVVIWYASHQDRLTIERLIGSKTFFGIPYRLQNR